MAGQNRFSLRISQIAQLNIRLSLVLSLWHCGAKGTIEIADRASYIERLPLDWGMIRPFRNAGLRKSL
jgi:hypothetical protein